MLNDAAWSSIFTIRNHLRNGFGNLGREGNLMLTELGRGSAGKLIDGGRITTGRDGATTTPTLTPLE